MALTDYADYKSKQERAQPAPFLSGNPGAGTASFASAWTLAPLSGAVPTTAAALNNTTTGAMLRDTLLNSYTAARWLSKIEFSSAPATNSFVMLVDRLSHQGGLDGTLTAAQTTNLPTTALTRYTSGVGVFAALEIYTAVGGTATTATLSYTNQAGTPGRTSKSFVFGGSGNNQPRTTLIVPLQDGDTGVRSVESVTLAATTGTIGAFGVTLFKPLLILPIMPFAEKQTVYDAFLGGASILNEIQDGCCLNFMGRLPSNAANFITGDISFIEG
jgi:hypothetical protein